MFRIGVFKLSLKEKVMAQIPERKAAKADKK
jgi:hypothetical protein